MVAVAPLLADALKAATRLESEGISIEVVDPRSLLPFDHRLLRESVTRTGRLSVFDDANRTCGFAAEVSAWAAEELFAYLRAPVVRVTRTDVPVPFSTALDKEVLPRAEQLEEAVRGVMNYHGGRVFRALHGGD